MMESTSLDLQAIAEQALQQMLAQGFDDAQVQASHVVQDELNLQHNEASLLRSTEAAKLSLHGILDGRMAHCELASCSPEALCERVAALFADACQAPQDEANAVSSGQQAHIVQGPQQADLDLLARKVAELLAFREHETPKMQLDDTAARHLLQRSHLLTSQGSRLACSLGWYALEVAGTARDGSRCSSYNAAGGATDGLDGRHVADCFGIGEMMRETERQIHTRALGGKFMGDVVLAPTAVADLLDWLLGQLGDTQLIGGTSLYRHSERQAIASPLLTLKSRFQAPGVAPLSADGFISPPVELLSAGTLEILTPSLYGSRKTGLPHVPLAAAGGWEIAAGTTPRSQLLEGLSRGALVGRLSMGNPAPNGDFSAVIKNSFAVEGGTVGAALSEAMIAGNFAQMLRDVAAVSQERLDTGRLLLPWLRIAGVHYS